MIWSGGLLGAFTPFGVSRYLCSSQAIAWGEEGWVGMQCLFSGRPCSMRVRINSACGFGAVAHEAANADFKLHSSPLVLAFAR